MARARSSNYGFFPAPGTDYSVGQEPEIATRLARLGKSLKLHIIGISGYRTPAHSLEVGGFANDPHTRGQASDSPGTENVPENVLRRFGLTRPLPGASEADHIQLFGGSVAKPRNKHTVTLADLWTQAGGPRNVAPIMAAIAMAESGGRTGATNQNSNGTIDYGLWQINSSHTQFDPAKLTSDPAYNARAAVAVYRSQGLGAWTTYTSGAYKSFMGGGSKSAPTFGRTRPGGAQDNPGQGLEDMFSQYYASFDPGSSGDPSGTTQDVSFHIGPLKVPFNIPGVLNPLDWFKAASGAVNTAEDFFKLLGWIFNPRNILRFVEFMVGIVTMILGVVTMFQIYRGGTTPFGRAGEAVSMTPVGRAARTVSGARQGRAQARRETRGQERSRAYSQARSREIGRQGTKRNNRESRKTRDIPF